MIISKIIESYLVYEMMYEGKRQIDINLVLTFATRKCNVYLRVKLGIFFNLHSLMTVNGTHFFMDENLIKFHTHTSFLMVEPYHKTDIYNFFPYIHSSAG